MVISTRQRKGLVAGGLTGAWAVAVLAALAVVRAEPAWGQTAENVAVVINQNSEASVRIGEYYARIRGIPASNVFRIRTIAEDAIDRALYQASIEQPIAAGLRRGGLQDRVLYLVLTKGVPLRITGNRSAGQAFETMASVDSELTLLYRRMTGQAVPVAGRVENPYYLGSREPSALVPFTHRDHDIYLVTRLDAFTVAEALSLVDRGVAPVTEGRIVLDQQDRLVNRTGEDWLAAAAERVSAGGHGERVVLETTVKGIRNVSPVLGYYSWGSNDPRNRERSFNLGFVRGSLAATFDSTGARTFREPPEKWVPTGEANPATWFADSPHALVGDLIRAGATGVAGHVAEPYLQSAVRPEILFPVYLNGANLVEAFYAALPDLSWQAVVVGDPLCAPFRRQLLARADLDGGVDPDTTLSRFYSRRRIAGVLAGAPGASERAATLAVRGEALMVRGDDEGARAAFEEATRLSPQIAMAQEQLGMLYEVAGEIDAAIERFRRVIEFDPKNVIALNNLAYRLAVTRNAPAEALPLATRAAELAPQSVAVLDTLAWVQYLLGQHATAVKTMATVVRAAPQSAEIRLHAAIIYAANGARAVAEDQLGAALELDPSLEGTPQVTELRQRLERLATGK
jgi:uncharacterized protein (TIGR03790 family)